MRIAAIGCSHTAGYHVSNAPEENVPLTEENWPFSGRWQDNNWAEEYINSKNADGVIFARIGNGWYEYSEWLDFLFKKYNDITEVIVQNTYWNRFRVTSINPPDYEHMIPLEALYKHETTKGRIDCWTKNVEVKDSDDPNYRVIDAPHQIRAKDYVNTVNIDVQYHPRFQWIEPDLRRITYMEGKTWLEIMSLKSQRDWLKEIYILQTLCKENNAELKLFGLNKWTWIPSKMKDYFNFDSIQVATDSVDDWFTQNKRIDIQKHTVDDEHYSKEIHRAIALEYLPSQFCGNTS
ncbi:MAG: hypothetical protein CMA31_00680 [Euryarchaeota archaeon]|nr:hypothetical protein [Euryarchaeota archaeon]